MTEPVARRLRPVRRWWTHRSLRLRLVLLTIVPLIAALVVGAVSVAVLFSRRQIAVIDAKLVTQGQSLSSLVSGGQVPDPLPTPAASPVLSQVLSTDGRVLAASAAASRTIPLDDSVPAPGAVLVETDEANPYGNADLRLRIEGVVDQSGRRYVVVTAQPLTDVRSADQAVVRVLVILVPTLTVLAALLGWVVVGATLRPVERLRARAEQLASDALSSVHRRDRPTPLLLPDGRARDELSRLGGTLDDLIRALTDAARMQQDFAAAAAHELRSPLAAMTLELDVADAHPDSLSVGELSAGLRPSIERLNSLVEQLLVQIRALDPAAHWSHAVVDLRRFAPGGEPVPVLGDAAALTTVVDNLTGNARRYARSVRISVGTDGGQAVLAVDDDGPGVPAADRERIFQRWVRLDDARDRDSGGFGLGLALVRDIVTGHGGTVAVTDSALGGARVEVRLPLADGDRPGR